jgi:hypothetical protein
VPAPDKQLQRTVTHKQGGSALMSLKEKFENNPAIWGASLFGAGFLLAVGLLTQFDFNSGGAGSARSTSQSLLAVSKQIEELTAKHNERLAELQAKLLENEKEATYGGNIESYQKNYVAAADRIRKSISEENESYAKQLEQLARIAKGS